MADSHKRRLLGAAGTPLRSRSRLGWKFWPHEADAAGRRRHLSCGPSWTWTGVFVENHPLDWRRDDPIHGDTIDMAPAEEDWIGDRKPYWRGVRCIAWH